jgi:signal transduction histidine kinase
MEDSKIGKFPSQIGILAVAYDLHAATAIALHDALLRTLTLAATLGGICLLMGFFFNWALLQRVQHLVKISQQIAQSDFTARAKLHGSDELALLANAFNEMGSHLQIKTNALQDALKKLTEANELKDQLIIREKQARIDAEKSVQLRDDFLAIASHELRTPLTPLKMQVQLMQRHLQDITPTTFPKIGVLLNVIESTNQQLDRFLKLIEDLLDVSRISSEKLVLSLEETDLSLLISDEVMHLEKELLKAKCKVKLTIQPQVKGFFDRTRIKQVATTLLSNAMKYGAGKPIEVSVSSTKNGSQFSVRDYGIGIAKEDQNKIFGRFERVAPIKYFGGLGLGLYIASNIVIAHGGTIRFWSEPGAGTCFTVELPLQQKSS